MYPLVLSVSEVVDLDSAAPLVDRLLAFLLQVAGEPAPVEAHQEVADEVAEVDEAVQRLRLGEPRVPLGRARFCTGGNG